jgi:hypothetical protein
MAEDTLNENQGARASALLQQARLNLQYTKIVKIERDSSGSRITIRLIGQLHSEYIDKLKTQIADCGSPKILDLADVNLVDVEAIQFLVACESEGEEIRNCSRYIREWMDRERDQKERQSIKNCQAVYPRAAERLGAAVSGSEKGEKCYGKNHCRQGKL